MKTSINNRAGNKICVVVEQQQAACKLAFVMHGLSGNKEEPHVRAMAEAFLECGYTLVTWDAVHTFGESEGGNYEDATTTNYYSDLEDVISWSEKQSWYSEPYVLCGHSLGGISTALFAEKYSKKVRALAPISTVVSGKLSLETKANGELEAWKRNGMNVSMSRDGKLKKRLKWSHMEDRLTYDLLKGVDKLRMPVLLVVGDNDVSTPPQHQQILFDKLPGKKEMHIIDGAEHSFYEPHEQQELKQIIKQWLQSL